MPFLQLAQNGIIIIIIAIFITSLSLDNLSQSIKKRRDLPRTASARRSLMSQFVSSTLPIMPHSH